MGSDKGFEERVLSARQERYIGLPARGLSRSRIWRNVRALWNNARALRMARSAVREFNPGAAVGCGGYASYFPIRAARTFGIPYVLQEQNRIPGLATRWLAAKANRVFIAYEQTQSELPQTESTALVGNPVDPRLATLDRAFARSRWNLSDDERVVLVAGGSGGARSINDNIAAGLLNDCSTPTTLLWQTGRHTGGWDGKHAHGWRVIEFEFTDAMTEAYVAADLIIARAGALTVSEIAAAGRAAILVPFPHATADHQTKNASVLAEAGGAVVIADRELKSVSLLDRADALLQKKEEVDRMASASRTLGRPNASKEIADYVISLLIES
jgi:UDP-N-acetylglucosamine--N-acetylmuramyl-(pentapeptide) pyrophosphoryl-undecaprenol N-acetylglucosamine transferase